MLRYLIILLLPLTLFSQTEEKRLALVIGNSNYDKGSLNNPVNDALLMARTLDSLDFDVILDTNIANKENFIRTIREFGNKRSDYDVAFVYYAGHGIQVGAENFLLPTKVNFETEYDVMDFGVSVQNIMRYLTGMTNQVNILVLDACRDNPFEGNWNKTRSLKGGGLAKIPPPTGSLIAFSTDAGNTAADGDGKNSVYCQSLCKNIKLSETSLDQVFRNVRSDVLKQTNGNQRPVEASQLTGESFYFVKPSIRTSLNILDKYIVSKQLDIALNYCNYVLKYHTNNSAILAKRGHIFLLKNNKEKALQDYKNAISINPKQFDAYFTQIVFEESLSDFGIIQLVDNSFDKLDILNSWVKLDSFNAIAFQERARVYNWELGEIDKAKLDIKEAFNVLENINNHENSQINYIIINDKNSVDSDYLYATIYVNEAYILESSKEYDLALSSVDKAIEREKKKADVVQGWSFYQKAALFEQKGEITKARNFYFVAKEKMPREPTVFFMIARLYNFENYTEKANEFFNYAVDLNEQNYLLHRSIFYFLNKKYHLALEDLIKCDFIEAFTQYVPLIKCLIYQELGVQDLAKRELKKYLSINCSTFNLKSSNSDTMKKCLEKIELPVHLFSIVFPQIDSKYIETPYSDPDDLIVNLSKLLE